MLFLILPGSIYAQRLDLSSFIIDTQDEKLIARFSLVLDNFERIKSSLDNGSKIVLICDISLRRDRILFWDHPVRSIQTEVGLEKDMISGMYNVVFPGQKRRMNSFEKDDFHMVFENMSVVLSSLDEIEPGHRYNVRIQARMISRGVPVWIKRTLFFWSWDLARSSRYEMEFSL